MYLFNSFFFLVCLHPVLSQSLEQPLFQTLIIALVRTSLTGKLPSSQWSKVSSGLHQATIKNCSDSPRRRACVSFPSSNHSSLPYALSTLIDLFSKMFRLVQVRAVLSKQTDNPALIGCWATVVRQLAIEHAEIRMLMASNVSHLNIVLV